MKISIETSITANIDKVWTCWTSPEHITKWNFASDDWACPRAINDLRPQGKFNYRMEAKDGSMGFDFTGVYDEIITNELIVYKLDDGRTVRIDFNEDEKQVKVVEEFEADGSHSAEQQKAGWQAILNNFKKHVESERNRDQDIDD